MDIKQVCFSEKKKKKTKYMRTHLDIQEIAQTKRLKLNLDNLAS